MIWIALGLVLFVLLSLTVFYFVAKWLIVDRPEKKAANAKNQKKTTSGSAERTDSRRLGYRYADRHIFVHGKYVYTGVRFVPTTDEYLSHAELISKVKQATHVLQGLVKNDPLPFQVRGTYRPVTAEEWADEAIRRCWNPTPSHVAYLGRTADYLTEKGTARPETYLIVQIGTVAPGAAEDSNALLTGTADEQFDPDEVARWDALATEVQQKLALMNTVPMTKDDLLWLIRKPKAGHCNPLPVEIAKRKPWGAGEFALTTDFDATNHLNGLTIHHINEDPDVGPVGAQVDSHMCMLIASEWPKEMPFDRDTAWMRFIANLGAQVEINYRGTLMPSKEFGEEVKKMYSDLVDEEKDMARTGQEPDREMQYNIATAKTLHDDVKESKIPAVEGQVTLMLSAPSEDDLTDMVRQVTNLCAHHIGVTFVRPRRAQWRLFEAMLPGTAQTLAGLPRVQLQEAEVFGIGLPNAGAEVGDNVKVAPKSGDRLGWRGDFIGMAGEVPVHYTTPVGIERDRGGGVAIIGSSGSGKSSLALLKFFQESEAGTRCVALDPKVDFAQFCLYLSFGNQVVDPEFEKERDAGTLGTPDSKYQPVDQRFWDDTDIIDIVRASDGVFDPWQITGDLAKGEILATTMLEMFVGPDDWKECRTPAKVAFKDARNDYQDRRAAAEAAGTPVDEVPLPTLNEIINRVLDRAAEYAESREASWDAKKSLADVAATLEPLKRLPYARLAFSDNPAGLGALHKRRTVFTLRGMDAPTEADSAEWGPEQRMAGTIMYVLTRLMKDLLDTGQERNPVTGRMGWRPKALFIDEAYTVTANREGRNAIRTNLAQGRSYGLATVLIDQQAKRLANLEEDSADATGNQFHTVFVFDHKTNSEARRAVPLLGRESNASATADALLSVGSNASAVMDTGVCVMRDADQRVATVDIDLVFAELLRASATNPTTRSIKQAEPLNPDRDQWSFISDAERAQSVADGDSTEDEAVAGDDMADDMADDEAVVQETV